MPAGTRLHPLWTTVPELRLPEEMTREQALNYLQNKFPGV